MQLHLTVQLLFIVQCDVVIIACMINGKCVLLSVSVINYVFCNYSLVRDQNIELILLTFGDVTGLKQSNR